MGETDGFWFCACVFVSSAWIEEWFLEFTDKEDGFWYVAARS